MPLPSRQDELYRKVLADIRERFLPGSILPGEPEYARQIGCGRTTLRKVLSRLAEEGRIIRTHSGTKVLNAGGSARPAAERPIFLLVPCSEYVELIDSVSLSALQQFISGAMRGAIANDRQLVTLPISETNRDNKLECTDISIQQLSLLKPGDLVLFLGRWYRRLIPFLAETGCRYGSITQFPLPLPEIRRNNSIAYYGFTTTAFMEAALTLLKANGAKNIGCFWFSLEPEELKQTNQYYRKRIAELGLSGEIKAVHFHTKAPEKEEELRKLCETNRFDSIIVVPHLFEPWEDSAGAWMKNMTLVVGKNSSLPGIPEDLPLFELEDPMYKTAETLVTRLLKEPEGSADFYPAPLSIGKDE